MPHRLTVVRAVELAVLALVTVSVLPRFGVRADLVLALVVAVALRAGSQAGALMGLVAGMLLDLLPPGSMPLGLTAVLYAVAGAVVGFLQSSLRASVLVPVLSLALSALGVAAFDVAVRFTRTLPIDLRGAALFVLMSTLLGSLLVPLMIRWETALVRRGLA